MGSKFYFDCPILLAIADQVRICSIRIQCFRGHLQRFTPGRPPSPKVSQNPNNSESYSLLVDKGCSSDLDLNRRSLGEDISRDRRRPEAFVSRYAGLLAQKSQIHAAFAQAWPEESFVQAVLAQITCVPQHCSFGETPNSRGPRVECARRSSTAGARIAYVRTEEVAQPCACPRLRRKIEGRELPLLAIWIAA